MTATALCILLPPPIYCLIICLCLPRWQLQRYQGTHVEHNWQGNTTRWMLLLQVHGYTRFPPIQGVLQNYGPQAVSFVGSVCSMSQLSFHGTSINIISCHSNLKIVCNHSWLIPRVLFTVLRFSLSMFSIVLPFLLFGCHISPAFSLPLSLSFSPSFSPFLSTPSPYVIMC